MISINKIKNINLNILFSKNHLHKKLFRKQEMAKQNPQRQEMIVHNPQQHPPMARHLP